MLKMIITDAGISKGYGDKPALRFSEKEGGSIVRFRIGKRVYDSRCEGNYRWINLNVKAFGGVCERIRKMKLKEGSFVNLIGRYDEESWTDDDTKEVRTAPILIVDEVEYCYSGNGQKDGQSGGSPASQEGPPSAGSSEERQSASAQPGGSRPEPKAPPAAPDNFSGFEGFGGGSNPFF